VIITKADAIDGKAGTKVKLWFEEYQPSKNH
jgi:hypothetical protein